MKASSESRSSRASRTDINSVGKALAALIPLALLITLVGYCSRDNSSSSFPKKYVQDRTNFTDSMTRLRESRELSQSPVASGQSFTMPADRERKMYAKIEEGLALSRRVNDAFLDYVHPELRHYYRDKLIAGTEIFYQGLQANKRGDYETALRKQLEGNRLGSEWGRWWDEHRDALIEGAFPK